MSAEFALPSETKPPSEMVYVWQAVNIVMTVFFILAACANLNDDDWYLWVPMYMLPAFLSCSIVVKPKFATSELWNSMTLVLLGMSCVYALYQIIMLFGDVGTTLQNPLVHETGREMGGLFIIIAWLCISKFTNIARPSVAAGGEAKIGLMSAALVLTILLTFIPLFLWSLCWVGDWHKHIGHCSGMFK